MSKKGICYFTSFLLALTLIIVIPGQDLSVYATGDGNTEALGDIVDVVEDQQESGNDVEATESTPAAESQASQADLEKKKKESERKSLEDKMAGINKELDALEAQQAEISKNINSTKGELESKQAVVSYIGSQISTTLSEISLLESKISLLEEDIQLKEEEIEAKREEYEENYDTYLNRLRELYMFDDSTTLGLLLGTDDFVDFLTTADMINRIADHDQELMKNLVAEREALEGDMAELEVSKTDLEGSRALAETKRSELASQQTVAKAQVQDVLTLQQEYEADLAESKAKAAAMQAEIDRIYEQIKMSENAYVGGEMAWPVPNYYTITSRYGWRFGGSDFHTGMDISGGGVHGKPVVAANDGTVAAVNWAHSPGRGYGIYIILDHGGQVSTLYGHLSNISVSVGQQVSRGQTIGAVGSTGWSTGPHLHFEVRQSGKHVNPEPYVTG